MRDASACDRCRDVLPEYAAGTLPPDDRATVEDHLRACTDCAGTLADWMALAGAVNRASRGATPDLPFEASWNLLAARIAPPLPDAAMPAPPLAPIGRLPDTTTAHTNSERAERDVAAFVVMGLHVLRVTGAQVRLLRPAMWIASALGIALAVLYALTLPHVVGELDVLAFALPLIAATGTAFLYGPDVDAGLELALATPTSPRLVLLGRFALLFGYDAALALAGTSLLSVARHDGFVSLASAWLGPMALLSTLSLTLSLILGPAVAVGGAAALWLSRALRLDGGLSLHISAGAFWPTPQVLALSLALLTFALLYVTRQERLRPDYDT